MANEPMLTREEVTPVLVRELLKYNPETGYLAWLPRSSDLFYECKGRHGEFRSKEKNMNAWNAKYAGKEAFTTIEQHGYKVGRIFKMKFYAHRIAWAYENNEWPEYIDHINGNRTDNRIENLRSASNTENARNSGISKANNSGKTGVYFDKSRGLWVARIGVGYKSVFLGRFATSNEAIEARDIANSRYNFSEGHGERISVG